MFGHFPNLSTDQDFQVTSPIDQRYNCIAWAYGISHLRMWPNQAPAFFWPQNIPNTATINSFIALFSSIGYIVCANGVHEADYTKIVIFTDSNGVPTHAARQLIGNKWTSKLGLYEDIQHSINGMNGGVYGNATVYMRKQIAISTP